MGTWFIPSNQGEESNTQKETNEVANIGSWQTAARGKRLQGKQRNNINTVGKNEWEWVREKTIVDSGTIDTVGGPMHVAAAEIRATTASTNGIKLHIKKWT